MHLCYTVATFLHQWVCVLTIRTVMQEGKKIYLFSSIFFVACLLCVIFWVSVIPLFFGGRGVSDAEAATTYTICASGCDYTTIDDAVTGIFPTADDVIIDVQDTYVSSTEPGSSLKMNEFGSGSVTFTCESSSVAVGKESAGIEIELFTSGSTVENCQFTNVYIYTNPTQSLTDISVDNNTFTNGYTSQVALQSVTVYSVDGNTDITRLTISSSTDGIISNNSFRLDTSTNLLRVGATSDVITDVNTVFSNNSITNTQQDNYFMTEFYNGTGYTITSNTFFAEEVLDDANGPVLLTLTDVSGTVSGNLFLNTPSSIPSSGSGTGLFVGVATTTVNSHVDLRHNSFVYAYGNGVEYDDVGSGIFNLSVSSSYNIFYAATSSPSGGSHLTTSYAGGGTLDVSSDYDGFWNLANAVPGSVADTNSVFLDPFFSNTTTFSTVEDYSGYLDVNGTNDIGHISATRSQTIPIGTGNFITAYDTVSTTVRDGDTLNFSAGTFEAFFPPQSNITILGQGSTTIFEPASGGSGDVFTVSSTEGVTFRNLVAQGAVSSTESYTITNSIMDFGGNTYDDSGALGSPANSTLILRSTGCEPSAIPTDGTDITGFLNGTSPIHLALVNAGGNLITLWSPDNYHASATSIETACSGFGVNVDLFVEDVFSVSDGEYAFQSSALSGAGVSVNASYTSPPNIEHRFARTAGFKFFNANLNILESVTSTGNGYGVWFSGTSATNIVSSSVLSSSVGYDVYSDASGDNALYNVTFNTASSSVVGTGDVDVYVRARASVFGDGSPLSGVDVTFTRGDLGYTETVQTSVSGYTPYTAFLLGYTMDSSSIAITNGGYNPWTISSVASGAYDTATVTSSLVMPDQTVSLVAYAGGAPSAPTNFVTTSVATSSVSFSWTDNASGGSQEDHLILDYITGSTASDFPGVTTSIAQDATTATVTSLDINTQYTFRIAATNTTGTSAYATSSAFYTLANPPTSLTAGTITADSIQVSWGVNGNPAGTEFYADIDSGTDCDWTADATSCTFSGLSAGTTYTIQIKARNGDEVETAYTTAITPATSASGGGGGGGGGGPVEPPTKPTDPGDLLSINAGALYTNNPTVTLTLNNVFATQYLVSETNDFTGQTFLTTPATRSFTLSTGDGTKTIYGRFQKDGQHVYDVMRTIILDTKAPNSPVVSTVSQSAKPTVSGTSEDGAVIAGTSEARSDIRVYDLDEGAGCTVVDLQGANPGVFAPCVSASSTSASGMSWSTGGIRGKAISFSGTAGVLTLGTQSPSNGNASMGVWFKPSQSATAKQVVLAYGAVGDQITLEIENNSLFFVDNIDGRNIKTSLGSVSAGSWHHVLITIAQNGKKYVYRNGLEVANVLGSGLSGLNIGSPTLVLGGQSGGSSLFVGIIDDVLFSSTVFTNSLSALVYKEKGGAIDPTLDPSLGVLTTPTDTNDGPTTPSDTSGGVTPATYSYPFSEGSGCNTTDVRGGKVGFLGPQCEVNNAPTWITGVSGTGKALSFDGVDDYVSLQAPYARNTAVTVSAWYKTDDTTTQLMTVVGGVSGSRFEMYVSRGKPTCRVYDTAQHILFAPSVVVGGWHHSACVTQYSPSPKTSLYVDGVLVGTMDFAPTGLGGNWYAGRSASAGTLFRGSIDNIKIWNQALSASDMAIIGTNASVSNGGHTGSPFSSSVILASTDPFTIAFSSLLAATENTPWSYTYSSTLPYGAHLLSITATDRAGNTSAPSMALVYVSSDTPPEDIGVPPEEPTCGVEGKPLCPVEPTCGTEDTPACPVEPTCGTEDTPACPVEPTCGVTGKPACSIDPSCGVPGKPACAGDPEKNPGDPTDPNIGGDSSGTDMGADGVPGVTTPTTTQVTTTVLDATIKSIQDTFASIRDEGIVETVKNIATSLTKKIAQVATSPAVQQANRRVVAPALLAAGVTNVALGFQLPHAIAFLRYFFGQPLLLLRRRTQKKWGVVYNAYTKQPIDLATVRVLSTDTGRVIQSQVTDMYGRYFLILDPGTYRIEVDKPGFARASTFVKGKREDAGYTNVYHVGEIISATPEDSELSVNIPLDPILEDQPTAHIVREYAKKTFHYSLSLAGFGVSILSFVISPTPLIGALVLFHVVFFVMFRLLSGKKKKGAVGIIRDSQYKSELKHVVVRIFDTAYNKLVDTAVTDSKGRYAALVGPSRYYVTYDKPGYEKKKSETIDMSEQRTKGTGGVIARDEVLAPVRVQAAGVSSVRDPLKSTSPSTRAKESRVTDVLTRTGDVDDDAVDNLKDIAQYGGKES
jgi:hypothetical protein